MKPTETEIADFARQEANRSQILSSYPFDQVSVEYGAVKGAQWAISLQPEWVPVQPRTPELIAKLESMDSRLIQCLFDNGEILAFNDSHPFAVMTHYCFLPQPPTK